MSVTMERVDVFSLAKHEGPYESWPLETALLNDGRPTGTRVPGYVVEAQYRHGSRYLLVISWDCPYEEAQEILLLSEEGRILSRKHVGAPYNSVWINAHNGHEVIDERSVVLHSGTDLDIVVSVRDKRPLWIGPLLRVKLVRKRR
jgi:hypothetical protein